MPIRITVFVDTGPEETENETFEVLEDRTKPCQPKNDEVIYFTAAVVKEIYHYNHTLPERSMLGYADWLDMLAYECNANTWNPGQEIKCLWLVWIAK